MTRVYNSLKKNRFLHMMRYLFGYIFSTFPEQFSKNTHINVTRCLGDLVTKPDKKTTTNPASKPMIVRNQLYLTKMTPRRCIIETFSWNFKVEPILDQRKRWVLFQ